MYVIKKIEIFINYMYTNINTDMIHNILFLNNVNLSNISKLDKLCEIYNINDIINIPYNINMGVYPGLLYLYIIKYIINKKIKIPHYFIKIGCRYNILELIEIPQDLENKKIFLAFASMFGSIDVIKLLIPENSKIINITKEILNDIIIIACDNNQYNVLKYLLKTSIRTKYYNTYQNKYLPCNIDVNYINTTLSDKDMLTMACIKNNIKIVNILLKYGADPNYDTNSYMRYIFENNNYEIAKLLVKYGMSMGVYYDDIDNNIRKCNDNIKSVGRYFLSIGMIFLGDLPSYNGRYDTNVSKYVLGNKNVDITLDDILFEDCYLLFYLFHNDRNYDYYNFLSMSWDYLTYKQKDYYYHGSLLTRCKHLIKINRIKNDMIPKHLSY